MSKHIVHFKVMFSMCQLTSIKKIIIQRKKSKLKGKLKNTVIPAYVLML